MKMIFALFCLVLVSTSAHAAGSDTIQCEWPASAGPQGKRVEIIQLSKLTACDDLKLDILCDYHEGRDSFWAFGFEKRELAALKPGQKIRGTYLEGLVHTTWLITREESVACARLN